MAEQVREQMSSRKGDGSIKQLLETEQFIQSMKENFGLTRTRKLVCGRCREKQGNKPCSNCGYDEIEAITVWEGKDDGIMNEQGAKSFISTLRTFVDRNQITSDFSSQEIQSIMMDFHEKFAEEIFWEWDKYGINNKAQAHKVITAGTGVVWSLFKRAQGGETLDSISGMGKDVQKSVQREEENNSSPFGLGLS